MADEGKSFHVLSLTGGGFRGLYTARVLQELEQTAGRPIGQCFDLIAGTSIGGILALAVAFERPMAVSGRVVLYDGCRQGNAEQAGSAER